MTNNDIIIVDNISSYDYKLIVKNAVKYALISLPFTINRMRIPNHKQRVLNIAKGKIAEGLFKWFSKTNNINIDFDSCETPFWQIDKRDFMFNGSEWDIKNNYIYYSGEYYHDYVKLPALIPNRHANDQWSTRMQRKIQGSAGVKYLFSFLKGADLNGINRRQDFLSINLSMEQLEFISDLYMEYRGMPQNSKPFEENWFWNELNKKGDNDFFTLSFMPHLIITGYADVEYWNMFKDTGPYSENNYQNYFGEKWYEKVGRNSTLKWLNGTLWTKITNKTCPVQLLPAFKGLL